MASPVATQESPALKEQDAYSYSSYSYSIESYYTYEDFDVVEDDDSGRSETPYEARYLVPLQPLRVRAPSQTDVPARTPTERAANNPNWLERALLSEKTWWEYFYQLLSDMQGKAIRGQPGGRIDVDSLL